MALERELETYQREWASLKAENEGRFVVIKEDTVLGWFDTYADALQAGYAACGVTEFLVKQANAVEKVYHFTRELRPCHT